jgi:hypothetical protein
MLAGWAGSFLDDDDSGYPDDADGVSMLLNPPRFSQGIF